MHVCGEKTFLTGDWSVDDWSKTGLCPVCRRSLGICPETGLLRLQVVLHFRIMSRGYPTGPISNTRVVDTGNLFFGCLPYALGAEICAIYPRISPLETGPVRCIPEYQTCSGDLVCMTTF